MVKESKKKKFCIRQRKFENNTDVYLMNFLQYYAKFSFLDHIGFNSRELKALRRYPNADYQHCDQGILFIFLKA